MNSERSLCVYLCIKDSAYVAKLTNKLQEVGYRVAGFTELDEFASFVFSDSVETPAAIVMSQTFPEATTTGIDVLTGLRQTFPHIPLIVCCKKDDLQSRLNALRAGATRYFSAPIDTPLLVDTLGELTGMQPAKPYRVLIIDDDELTLQIYSNILKQAGINAFTLVDPTWTLKLVDYVKPEVIVLDVNMPVISGFEIAAVLRERENSRDVPILFLTADSDVSTELDALRLGGDAFYVKPVEASRLKDAVVSRAKRYRERSQAKQRLDKLLYERDREHKALDRHALVSVADHQGDIIDINEMFCDVSGYSREELLGQNHRILKSGLQDDDFYRNIWGTILQGETWYGEKCNKRKDGSLYWIEATITPFMDSDGKPYQYVGISTDITQRKEHELKLTEAKQQAEKANQAKSEFLANMSHELRTPLNAIVGFSQLLDEAPDLQDIYKQDVSEIYKAGKHLLGLINDILELSKIESGHVSISTEEVELKSVVSECVSMVTQLVLDKGLTFGCDDFDSSIQVLGDRTKIRQILLNLLSNAIKYNRPGGSVGIIISQHTNNVRVCVKDTGIGISKSEMNNLFKPFSRLDARLSDIEGTGIGLTITKEMVERMDGEIGVTSEKGQGSEFWFSLPLANGNSNPLAKGHGNAALQNTVSESGVCARAGHAHQAHVKVVYVDDNQINLDILSQLLGRESCYEVHSVINPLDALSLMLVVQPDIIILDIHMPHLDGYELLELIKADANLSHLPVIALSAAAMDKDREKGLQAGFCKYLTKPLDYTLLQRTMTECLESASRHHQ